MPVTASPTVRAELPPVAETSVALHVEEPSAFVNEKRSPQFAAWPDMEVWVGETLTKSDPLSGGAPVAAPVTFNADHTGVSNPGLDVIGEAKSSTLPLLVRAAMSKPDAP